MPLGQLVKKSNGIIQTGPFGSQLHAEDYAIVGTPSIMPKNISVNGVNDTDIARIKATDLERLSRYQVKTGDIIYSRRGDVEKCALISERENGWLCGTGCILIRLGHSEISPEFLHAYLSHPLVRAWVVRHAIGATMPNLNTTILSELPILVPPKKTRKCIKENWTNLTKKILINSGVNQTLEQIAQALFKSWFVDFEPVKAKMAALEAGGSHEDATLAAMTAISGKDADALAFFEREHPEQYAELKATAELFPSAMQDSELGKIPEGWSIKPLDGIATYQNGLALQKFRPENENDFLPVVKIAQLKKGFSDGEEKASPNIKPECIIDNGDVVFSWSGSLMVDIWCGGQAALNQHLFKVSSTKYPKWLYYKYTAHHLIEFQRIAEAKAVTMGHIKREHLSQAKCLIPSSETICAFTPFFEPVLNRVISNRLESRKLENLRDTLLPKLLSGEITLPEAEQIISEEA
ncbi:restriction endonuclease subunit S [Salmonella enterica]|nr:restriction endonuclease subunit S [Salmonella enterica]